MCGGGNYSAPKDYGPIWKLSKDKKHISFYANTDFSYSGNDRKDCIGSTKWCREHCYLQNLPLPERFKDVVAKYNINQFRPDTIKTEPFGNDFIKAELVTFFAGGSLNALYYCNGAVDDWNILATTAIESFPLWFSDKTFRFFIRRAVKLNDDSKIHPNVVIIFSVDRDTKTDDIEWALESEIIKHISVVNHTDNRIIKAYIKDSLKNIISCEECNEIKYDCFYKKEKSLLLMEYKE